ncbi:glycosyl hydrolase family 95 catalytic domain-containing protein, partial [Klebsiella pneumoniae]|uniref:glycosyl hydrolase family 95 catalytic domain-containing protein n=1 Tax=Klebsiella pneumoniae TaxID=573 RepID=UPI003A8B8BC9
TSPENRFLHRGGECQVDLTTTMTMSIIKELFGNVVKAAEILHADSDVAVEAAAALPRLLPLRIGKDGRLMEWYSEHRDE